MEKFEITPTHITPGIWITPESNEVVISGRSIPENPEQFYYPLLSYLENEASASENMTFDLYLECLNSGSQKILMEMFYHTSISKALKINWKYDYDDDDMKTLGEIIGERLGLNIHLEPLF